MTRSAASDQEEVKVAESAETGPNGAKKILQIGKNELVWMYETLVKIRRFEERVGKEFAAGKIPGWVHLYIGEEAVAVGVCARLGDDDYLTSTHRGHGHCIAKGMDVKGMMAEVYGRQTGVCGGKGGSMHMADPAKGVLGAVPIVGGGVALALGPALTAKFNRTNQVAVAFFGDGAINQGAVLESLNLATVLQLPVIFVCENNLYAQSTPQSYALAVDSVADRGVAFGMPGVKVDGMDVFAVHEAAGEAVGRARQGEGPTLLEACTYRFRGHYEGDAQEYRTSEEMDYFRTERDPIEGFKRAVLEAGAISPEELEAIDAAVLNEIADAISYAEASPVPDSAATYSDVYG